MFTILFENSVEIPGPAVARLSAAARDAKTTVVMGLNERDGGTLYNTMLFIDSGDKTTARVGETTVADLVLTPETYEDKEISTRGTLTYDEENGQYSVGDEVVQIRVTFEPGGIEDLIDESVRVTGRVEYDSDGVYLDADRVELT